MNSEIKNNKSKTFNVLIMGGFIAAVLGLVLYFVTRLVCSIYVEIDPKLYAKMFMAWRIGGGDSSMILGRYKPLKATDLPSKDEVKTFIDKAQKEECFLISGNYPEHYPRDPEYQWSLTDGKDGAFYSFLALRLKVISKLEGKAVEKLVDDAKEGLKGKKLDTIFTEKFFIPDSKITSGDVEKIFDGKNVTMWRDVASDFVALLQNIYEEKPDYKFDGKNVGSKLDADIKKICSKLGHKDVSSEQIFNFFKNLGTVNTTSYESIIYSRFYYLFVFLTINNPYDFVQKSTSSGKKDVNAGQEKMLEMANIYAQIVSKVFPESYDYIKKDMSMFESITFYFGPNMDVSEVKNQEKNIKSALETAKKNAAFRA